MPPVVLASSQIDFNLGSHGSFLTSRAKSSSSSTSSPSLATPAACLTVPYYRILGVK
tara:strand:+ start:426 stop:596 length:171 start_codon:yes stop_codon:yes gene_type:complete